MEIKSNQENNDNEVFIYLIFVSSYEEAKV
jgi:hypothetical protein